MSSKLVWIAHDQDDDITASQHLVLLMQGCCLWPQTLSPTNLYFRHGFRGYYWTWNKGGGWESTSECYILQQLISKLTALGMPDPSQNLCTKTNSKFSRSKRSIHHYKCFTFWLSLFQDDRWCVFQRFRQVQGGARPTTEGLRENIGHNVKWRFFYHFS